MLLVCTDHRWGTWDSSLATRICNGSGFPEAPEAWWCSSNRGEFGEAVQLQNRTALDPRGPFFNPVAYTDPYTSIQIRRESIYIYESIWSTYSNSPNWKKHWNKSFYLIPSTTCWRWRFPDPSCHFPGETLLTELGFPTMTARKLFFNSSASVECWAMESFHRTQFHASFWTAKGYTSCFVFFSGKWLHMKKNTTLAASSVCTCSPVATM